MPAVIDGPLLNAAVGQAGAVSRGGSVGPVEERKERVTGGVGSDILAIIDPAKTVVFQSDEGKDGGSIL